MRMKLPFGKIAKWLGNVVLAAVAQAAVDRLSRPRAKAESVARQSQEDAVREAVKEALEASARSTAGVGRAQMETYLAASEPGTKKGA
jgi:hypothetical protein